MLQTFLRLKLHNVDKEHVWFQQYGATTDTTRRSLGVLKNMFPGSPIFLKSDVEWLPRSLHLSPCDSFLWGYLKNCVFPHRPQSLEELKDKIKIEIEVIPYKIIRRVIENFRKWLWQCIAIESRSLPDVIFKTR